MGYYTSYALSMFGDCDKVEAAEQDLLNTTAYEDGSLDSEVKELVETGGAYAKLYELPEYISEVAERNPDVLIILEGDGDEPGDLWEWRWKGTQEERQVSAIPPFENKNLWTENEKINKN